MKTEESKQSGSILKTACEPPSQKDSARSYWKAFLRAWEAMHQCWAASGSRGATVAESEGHGPMGSFCSYSGLIISLKQRHFYNGTARYSNIEDPVDTCEPELQRERNRMLLDGSALWSHVREAPSWAVHMYWSTVEGLSICRCLGESVMRICV